MSTILNLLQADRDLCICDYQPENGMYIVPYLPGIGNEWSGKALAEASCKESFNLDSVKDFMIPPK